MSAWFGSSSTPRVAQDPQPPPESDAPTHPNEPAWELVEALEACDGAYDDSAPSPTAVNDGAVNDNAANDDAVNEEVEATVVNDDGSAAPYTWQQTLEVAKEHLLSPDLSQLVARCLARQPASRPSVNELLAMRESEALRHAGAVHAMKREMMELRQQLEQARHNLGSVVGE